ncbi:MAG: LamG-like jellyroll fold domain-containing protein, partial [Promethearchaeota archaeon]
KILNEEIGPNNIEIWLTEFNIWYGLLGFRLEQTLEFKSALAAADIAVQGVHGGLDMMQQWSLINNWYFGFITDELILGERSIFKIYSLMIEGLGTQLINSTVNCPKFNLTEKFGNIQPRINVPYLDVMPTMDNNHLYIIMINKHPTKYLDVSTVINGLSLDNIITQKIINSSAPDIIDQNPPESMYKYDSGKVGQAIMLNESHSIFHGAHNNFFDDEGTLEFWFKPNWDGDDGKPHRIMSIGYNFGISKSSDNLLYAYFLTHEDTPEIIPLIIATPVSSWKAGVWQHIAITWNQENDFIMYINGTERYSEPFMDKRIYINPQHEVIIGSSIQYKVNGSDGYFDEFRTLNVSRNSSGILSDYILGNEGSALLVDDNTTILYHFEKSLLDSQRDERTHLTVKTFSCSSNNIPLKLPPCSISLIKISLYKDGDNSDGSDSKNGASSKSKREGNFSLILVGSLALGAGGVILTIFIVLVKHNKKKRI